MTNAGRRPDGPGWYWYEGPGQWRPLIDVPVWVSGPYVECRTRHRDEIVGDMPGDFTILSKPAAMPAPDWSQADEDADCFIADVNGYAYYFADADVGWVNGLPVMIDVVQTYVEMVVYDLPLGIDYRQTLQRRPEASE